MANDLAGEFSVKLADGKEHVVAFGARGLRELERVFKRPVLQFLDDARKNMVATWGYEMVHGALLAGLRHKRPGVDEAWLDQRFSTRMVDMIGYAQVVTDAILAATFGPEELRGDELKKEAPSEGPRPSSTSPGGTG